MVHSVEVISFNHQLRREARQRQKERRRGMIHTQRVTKELMIKMQCFNQEILNYRMNYLEVKRRRVNSNQIRKLISL